MEELSNEERGGRPSTSYPHHHRSSWKVNQNIVVLMATTIVRIVIDVHIFYTQIILEHKVALQHQYF